MASFTLRIDDEVLRKITAIAADRKIPVAEFVRAAINVALEDRAEDRSIEAMRAFIRTENDELFRALIKRRDEVISATAEEGEKTRVALIEWIKINLR